MEVVRRWTAAAGFPWEEGWEPAEEDKAMLRDMKEGVPRRLDWGTSDSIHGWPKVRQRGNAQARRDKDVRS